MKKLVMTGAATAIMFGSLANAGVAEAAQATVPTPRDQVVQVLPQQPSIQLLDCYGSTGDMGCGAGWFWRDGWRGWACYPC
ncbi:MAG: hypothetical protein AB7G47_03405 [Mycolicibacterium sp.]|uniref:hypothetical protein n=1 Tax=Mycolicibacterium sp. TaxID=2320850 RepID=UPI003D0DE7E0